MDLRATKGVASRFAEYVEPHPTRLIVGCPRCGVYRVMKAAIGALPKLKVDKRLEALTKAKIYASPKAWPTISKACL